MEDESSTYRMEPHFQRMEPQRVLQTETYPENGGTGVGLEKGIISVFFLFFLDGNGGQRSCKIMWFIMGFCWLWECHSIEIFLLFWSPLKIFKVPFYGIYKISIEWKPQLP